MCVCVSEVSPDLHHFNFSHQTSFSYSWWTYASTVYLEIEATEFIPNMWHLAHCLWDRHLFETGHYWKTYSEQYKRKKKNPLRASPVQNTIVLKPVQETAFRPSMIARHNPGVSIVLHFSVCLLILTLRHTINYKLSKYGLIFC